MITWQAILTILGVGALVPATIYGLKLYHLFFPSQTWKDSEPYPDSPDNVGSTDPFFTWFNANKGDMGKRIPVTLTTRLKAKIDNVTKSSCGQTAWKYFVHNEPDTWAPVTADLRTGDCHDNARVVAMLLQQAGLPASCLSFAEGLHSLGWHIVCCIDTDKGMYVCSVDQEYAMPWKEFAMTEWQRAWEDGMFHQPVK